MTYLIGGAALFLVFLGFVAGYLLGWRSGHLTGLDYAMRFHVFGFEPKITSSDVAEYTKDMVHENEKRFLSVKEETLKKIEEMRKSGIK